MLQKGVDNQVSLKRPVALPKLPYRHLTNRPNVNAVFPKMYPFPNAIAEDAYGQILTVEATYRAHFTGHFLQPGHIRNGTVGFPSNGFHTIYALLRSLCFTILIVFLKIFTEHTPIHYINSALPRLLYIPRT